MPNEALQDNDGKLNFRSFCSWKQKAKRHFKIVKEQHFLKCDISSLQNYIGAAMRGAEVVSVNICF